ISSYRRSSIRDSNQRLYIYLTPQVDIQYLIAVPDGGPAIRGYDGQSCTLPPAADFAAYVVPATRWNLTMILGGKYRQTGTASYLLRMASTGSSRAALIAGTMPAISPMSVERAVVRTTILMLTTTATPAATFTNATRPNTNSRPIPPPIRHNNMLSIRNCDKIKNCLAPSAF